MDRSELLKELHIDRDGRPGRPRARRVALLVLGLLVLGGAFWLALARGTAPVVRTAVARAATGEGAGSVLDASGYVTARRQATVSAKITGKVVEVNIEEGQ